MNHIKKSPLRPGWGYSTSSCMGGMSVVLLKCVEGNRAASLAKAHDLCPPLSLQGWHTFSRTAQQARKGITAFFYKVPPCLAQGPSALPDDNEPSGHLLPLKHFRGTCCARNCCAGGGKGPNAKCSWMQQGAARLQRSLHCYPYLGDLQEVGLLRMLHALCMWLLIWPELGAEAGESEGKKKSILLSHPSEAQSRFLS